MKKTLLVLALLLIATLLGVAILKPLNKAMKEKGVK